MISQIILSWSKKMIHSDIPMKSYQSSYYDFIQIEKIPADQELAASTQFTGGQKSTLPGSQKA